MQFGRVKPATQLHAPRVCFAYIKPILFPRKWLKPASCLNAVSEPSSRSVPAIEVCMPELAPSGKTGTGSRARTYDLRFWRPPLYQLSYARTRVPRHVRSTGFLRASAPSVKSGLRDVVNNRTNGAASRERIVYRRLSAHRRLVSRVPSSCAFKARPSIIHAARHSSLPSIWRPRRRRSPGQRTNAAQSSAPNANGPAGWERVRPPCHRKASART